MNEVPFCFSMCPHGAPRNQMSPSIPDAARRSHNIGEAG
ncbi:hypothetical protein SXCC_00511 [Gluconacetobacter sp. SXCC-1]|nr:hypothetical protein SXCC_00511 [Gluconacetobacter sp. SXCC-1]